MEIDKTTLIAEADVKAALDAAITQLAETSQDHAEKFGRYIHKSFRPNPELFPAGVVLMFHLGTHDLAKKVTKAGYPAMIATLISFSVKRELSKLPGVEAVFAELEGKG